MIAVDSNILIYAHRRDSEWHDRAKARMQDLAESVGAWAIPWPCVYEFFAIVTHPKIYAPPSTTKQALDQLDTWLACPTVTLLAEGDDHWTGLRTLLDNGRIAGPRVHDGRIAALCIAHGVRELWTADRDFSAFAALTTKNPLVAAT
jgi:hypothetical protein